MKTSYLLPVAALSTLLAGCGAAAVPWPATIGTAPPPPPVQPRITQNNSLVGHGANTATGLFGKPQLDVHEGAGRKLQFAGAACVLDVYYYPPRQGADPIATHVDARTPDGRDANIDSCVAALRR